jgi:hypothetical protein
MIELNSFESFQRTMVGNPEGREAGLVTAECRFGSIFCIRMARFPASPSIDPAIERSLNAAFR